MSRSAVGVYSFGFRGYARCDVQMAIERRLELISARGCIYWRSRESFATPDGFR